MHIHFIGIGGISMSGLAQICLHNGHIVSGSDSSDSYFTKKLKDLGATIYIGNNKDNISDNIDMAIYTAAISPNNEELLECKNKNIALMDRASFLGNIMKDYKNAIAVSGTHGKTSTTSMLSLLFEGSKLDPTILVGGNLKDIGGNVRVGSSQHFITEACEYVDSFLKFYPRIGIILNVEADHLDYFSGIEAIKTSFNKFSKLIPKDGYLIINGDDVNSLDTIYDLDCNIIKYGKEAHNTVIINDIAFDEKGNGSFSLTYEGNNLGEFKLSIPGTHNIYNATAAIMSALVSNIPLEDIKANLTKYTGVGRRFEYKGRFNDAVIIDDYAHHPTELKATLSAAKNVCNGKIWCVFQPHTYTRTKALLNDFSNSFSNADKIIITDIYAAREKDTNEIHSQDLVNKLLQNGVDALYLKTFEEITSYLCDNLQGPDMLITAGAGNVYAIGEMVLEKVK